MRREPVWAVLLAFAFAVGCAVNHGSRGTAHLRVEGSPASDIPLKWFPLAEAKRLALEQKKPMIVDFYVPEGCSRCNALAENVYADPAIARTIRDEFVLVRINLMANMTRDEIALGRKFDYNYDCLMVFLDYRGEVIEDLSGQRMCFPDYVEPEWFKRYLQRAAEANRAVAAGASGS